MKVTEQKISQTPQLLSSVPFLSPQLLLAYNNYSPKEGLSFLDCFDPYTPSSLLALHESCYEAFPGIYEAFLQNFLKKKWGLISQQDLLKNFHDKIIQNKTVFPLENNENIAKKIAITYEFGRNLNEFPFNCFLKHENIEAFRKKLFEGLKSFTMVEEKYINTSINKRFFPQEFKEKSVFDELTKGLFVLLPEKGNFAIWGLWKDHIRVVLATNPIEQQKDLLEIMEILSRISELFNGGYKFHKLFGYLSENSIDLGFNARISIETAIEEKKAEILKQFCKSCGWELKEKKEGQGSRVKISVRKPNLLVEEMDLLNNLVKGLIEG